MRCNVAKIRPTGDWLVVRKEPRKLSALELDIYRTHAVNYGTVVSVGPGRVTKKGFRIPPEVEVGDKVAYIFALELTESAKGTSAALSEGEFLLQEKDVLAVIE